jgi:HEPN domain-containing protein
MATRRQLQELAYLRLEEAETLYASRLYDGCAYLCGYAVELALKAKICAAFGVTDYSEKGSRLREALKSGSGSVSDLRVIRHVAVGREQRSRLCRVVEATPMTHKESHT